MVNKDTGEVRVNKELVLSPLFTFEDFKKTSFFNGHDGIKAIQLKEKQTIDNRDYFVSFFFRDSKLYAITLMLAEMAISEDDELLRKSLHDEILKNDGIKNGKDYCWGKVVSEYDRRSNSSEIVIIYRH